MNRTRLTRFINQRLAELPLAKPVFIDPACSVRDAVALMQVHSASCVIAGADSQPTGIFTERDILTKCMEDGFDWDQPLEGSVLTLSPLTVPIEATVADAVAIMQKHRYRTLPVTDAGTVVGLIRLGDLLTHLAEAFPEEVLNLPPRPHQVMEKREGG
jgi:CBS domain-containing protein